MNFSGAGGEMLSRLCSAVCLTIAGAVLLASARAATGSPNSNNQAARPWANRSLSALERANLLIKQMTLDEKITMLHGVDPLPVKAYVGYVPPNARLGIPAITLADGRAGVGNGAKNVTLLPAPIAAASSWNIDLMNAYGRVLGQEQWAKGTKVELGPSIDVVRVPEWGRTFESYGEDPYFNGQMAVAEIKGIQDEGPIADANMYLTMNQESNRFNEDSIVDPRTMQEIYLPPFAAAIEQGHVGTVMCAYVKTNRTYSCENADLLIDMLRQQLHFEGWVMSDWGATHSTVAAARNGLDQEMPGAKYFGAPLKSAAMNGQVSVAVIDQQVRRILLPMFRQGLFDKTQTGNWAANVRSPQHDSFSRMVAEQGTILLKNEHGLLPLQGRESIAVIGEAGSAKPKAEGGGSSGVIAPYVVSPLEGISKRAGTGTQVSYADGSDLGKAANTAKHADIAIVFVHTDETEGKDRPNLNLPGNQNQLISAVAAVNRKTIVVLDTGGPVLMPWVASVAALVEAWYSGQEDGNAIAAVLYGDVDPSAKLPLSFPRTAAAIPTSRPEQWPGLDGRSTYVEKLNVGYRWYDATHTQPLFPFGFGLSYTTFRVSHLAVTPESLPSGQQNTKVQVTVEVTNTGQRQGAEVVQVYVQQPAANGEPPHQLHAFGRVQLDPGETKPVTLTLEPSSFSIYDAAAKHWIFPDGTYGILAGTSSRDLPLHASIAIGRSGAAPGDKGR
jgi:beta-glucosidase